MTNRKQSRGECCYCEFEATKGSMTKHLATCEKRLGAIEKANAHPSEKLPLETIYHLRVQDACIKDFWLDLEMRGSATLKKLDVYLRAIWLECCGHMSEFSGGGWGSRKIGMSQTAEKVFADNEQITHIYDFGTSSETLILRVAQRTGVATTKHPIALMARNQMPEASCRYCEKPATHLCSGCVYEDEVAGFLCDEHLEGHPHSDEYGEPVALVNSPRLGMCGYDGPADAPY